MWRDAKFIDGTDHCEVLQHLFHDETMMYLGSVFQLESGRSVHGMTARRHLGGFDKISDAKSAVEEAVNDREAGAAAPPPGVEVCELPELDG